MDDELVLGHRSNVFLMHLNMVDGYGNEENSARRKQARNDRLEDGPRSHWACHCFLFGTLRVSGGMTCLLV